MGYIDFYERVKSLSKIGNLTIEYVVKQAGLSLGAYNSYRRRENLPRADEAQKIAQALGTTVEYLTTGKEPADLHINLIQDMQAVIDQYRSGQKSLEKIKP
jgi:transcriptional regulator with XRE-family HTH domain